jgi:hypothetical protein
VGNQNPWQPLHHSKNLQPEWLGSELSTVPGYHLSAAPAAVSAVMAMRRLQLADLEGDEHASPAVMHERQ